MGSFQNFWLWNASFNIPFFYGIYDIILLHLALKAGLVTEALVTVLHQSTLFTQMGLITFYTACLR